MATAGMGKAQAPQAVDVRAVMRTATRIALLERPPKEEVQSVAQAILDPARVGLARELAGLWGRPGTCLTLMKAVVVSLRRAEGEGPREERPAYLQFIHATGDCYVRFVDHLRLQHHPVSADVPSLLGRIVCSLARSGSLHSLARLIGQHNGTEQPYMLPAEAGSGAGASRAGLEPAAGPGTQAASLGPLQAGTTTQLGSRPSNCADSRYLLTATQPLVHYAAMSAEVAQPQGVAVEYMGPDDRPASQHGASTSTAGSAAASGGDVRSGRRIGRLSFPVTQELVTALAESHVLEHSAQLAFAAMCRAPATTDVHELFSSTLLIVANFLPSQANRQLAHDLGLPGPCLLHLFTAAAVEGLCELEAGSGGGSGSGSRARRYGLPAEAVAALRRLWRRPRGDMCGLALDRWAIHEVLYAWALLLMPGAGLPGRRFGMSTAAVYDMCMRVCGASVAAVALWDVERPCGVVSQRRVLPVTLPPAKSYCCRTAAATVLSAHEALEEQQRRRRRPNAAAAESGAAASGAEAAAAAQMGATQLASPGLVRPKDWWRAGVGALKATITLEGEIPRRLLTDIGTLLRYQLWKGQMASPLPAALPARAPPDLASALSAGLLPALEHLIRDNPAMLLEPSARDIWRSLLSWPQLGWLLAYGEPRQAAALVATIGKVLVSLPAGAQAGSPLPPPLVDMLNRTVSLVVDGLGWARARDEAAAAAAASSGTAEPSAAGAGGSGSSGGGGGGGGSGGAAGEDGGRSGGVRGEGCAAGAPESGAGSGASWDSAGSGGGARGGGGSGSSPPARDDSPDRQLRRLLSFALLRWSPVVAFKARQYMELAISREPGFAVGAWPPFLRWLQLLSTGLAWMRASGTEPQPGRHVPGPAGGGDAEGSVDVGWHWEVLGALHCIVMMTNHGRLAAQEVARELRSLLRQLLLTKLEAWARDRPAGSGSRVKASPPPGTVIPADMISGCIALFGPRGKLPDRELLSLVRAAQRNDTAAAGGAAAAGDPDLPPLPDLPPVREARSLLRTCHNWSCTSLKTHSEADLEAQLSLCRGCGAAWFCRSCAAEHVKDCAAGSGRGALSGGRDSKGS